MSLTKQILDHAPRVSSIEEVFEKNNSGKEEKVFAIEIEPINKNESLVDYIKRLYAKEGYTIDNIREEEKK